MYHTNNKRTNNGAANMRAKSWEQEGLWYWHILDEYGDEVACATKGYESREDCREEMYAALSDWE
jgi:hypothetical protein